MCSKFYRGTCLRVWNVSVDSPHHGPVMRKSFLCHGVVAIFSYFFKHYRLVALQWRHNDSNDVSNHRRLDCFLRRLFRRISKKTSKLCVTGLCEGNSPVTGPHKGPVTRKVLAFDDVIMIIFPDSCRRYGTTTNDNDRNFCRWSQSTNNWRKNLLPARPRHND